MRRSGLRLPLCAGRGGVSPYRTHRRPVPLAEAPPCPWWSVWRRTRAAWRRLSRPRRRNAIRQAQIAAQIRQLEADRYAHLLAQRLEPKSS